MSVEAVTDTGVTTKEVMKRLIELEKADAVRKETDSIKKDAETLRTRVSDVESILRVAKYVGSVMTLGAVFVTGYVTYILKDLHTENEIISQQKTELREIEPRLISETTKALKTIEDLNKLSEEVENRLKVYDERSKRLTQNLETLRDLVDKTIESVTNYRNNSEQLELQYRTEVADLQKQLSALPGQITELANNAVQTLDSKNNSRIEELQTRTKNLLDQSKTQSGKIETIIEALKYVEMIPDRICRIITLPPAQSLDQVTRFAPFGSIDDCKNLGFRLAGGNSFRWELACSGNMKIFGSVVESYETPTMPDNNLCGWQ